MRYYHVLFLNSEINDPLDRGCGFFLLRGGEQIWLNCEHVFLSYLRHSGNLMPLVVRCFLTIKHFDIKTYI